PVCSANTIDLTNPAITAGSDPGLNYSYWTNSAATIPLAAPTAIPTTGTYYIEATSASGCTVIKPVLVTISTTPLNLVVTDPAKVCSPATVDLTNPAITAGSDPGLTYTYWTDASDTTPVPDPKAVGISGTYYITATSSGGCSATKSVQVNVQISKALPGMRYPTVSTTPSTPLQLNARSLGLNYNYSWQPPVGLNFYNIQDPMFSYNQDVQYTITMTPPDGSCPTIDTLLVQVATNGALKSSLVVPNAWSPNGDGHNDKLYPLTIYMKDLKYFRVFNRWGQLMFETHTLGQGWDGTFNGVPQVMDVYTWIVEADGLDGVHYKMAGNSILMR
ncbi:MAG TPA: gliding motility-associated C-terminal domain-containing protein, partial [Chitinophagaceae bacterium]